eukprot:gene11389-7894_t
MTREHKRSPSFATENGCEEHMWAECQLRVRRCLTDVDRIEAADRARFMNFMKGTKKIIIYREKNTNSTRNFQLSTVLKQNNLYLYLENIYTRVKNNKRQLSLYAIRKRPLPPPFRVARGGGIGERKGGPRAVCEEALTFRRLLGGPAPQRVEVRRRTYHSDLYPGNDLPRPLLLGHKIELQAAVESEVNEPAACFLPFLSHSSHDRLFYSMKAVSHQTEGASGVRWSYDSGSNKAVWPGRRGVAPPPTPTHTTGQP